LQPIQQIGCLALRTSSLAGGQARVPVTSAPHHVAVASPGPFELAFIELPVLLPSPMEFQEQIAHLPRPHLAVLFPDELEFPQQMLVAQGVLALRIGKIGLPVVMHYPLAAIT